MPVAKRNAQGFGTGDPAIAIIDKDIIVPRALHFGKDKALVLGSHMIDVNQFGVAGVISAGNHIGQRVGDIQRGQTGNAQLKRAAVQSEIAVKGRVINGAGIYDIVDLSAFHQPAGLIAFLHGGNPHHINAQLADNGGGSRCGINFHTQIIQLFGQRNNLEIIMLINADKDADLCAG